MRQRFFVTSTGTGIGKSFITAALVRQATALGRRVMAYKPLISGFDPQNIGESDTGLLLMSLGLEPSMEQIERLSPWRFGAPLAPSMAARREGRTISFEDLVKHGRHAMAGPEELVIIEGVGGIMVPISDHHLVIDWIEHLQIDTILVTGAYLGTISHTLTSLEALQRRAIPIHSIIINESDTSPVPLADTLDELSRWTQLPIISVARRDDKISPDISELHPLLA